MQLKTARAAVAPRHSSVSDRGRPALPGMGRCFLCICIRRTGRIVFADQIHNLPAATADVERHHTIPVSCDGDDGRRAGPGLVGILGHRRLRCCLRLMGSRRVKRNSTGLGRKFRSCRSGLRCTQPLAQGLDGPVGIRQANPHRLALGAVRLGSIQRHKTFSGHVRHETKRYRRQRPGPRRFP